MPARDGTGPIGEGAMTGRGLGPCGAGAGYRGRRFFRRGLGMERGFGFRRMPVQTAITRKEEKELLQDDLKDLQEEMKEIEKRISELEKD